MKCSVSTIYIKPLKHLHVKRGFVENSFSYQSGLRNAKGEKVIDRKGNKRDTNNAHKRLIINGQHQIKTSLGLE